MIEPGEFTAKEIEDARNFAREQEAIYNKKRNVRFKSVMSELYDHIEKMAAAWLKENPGLDAVIVWDTRDPLVTSITIRRRE